MPSAKQRSKTPTKSESIPSQPKTEAAVLAATAESPGSRELFVFFERTLMCHHQCPTNTPRRALQAKRKLQGQPLQPPRPKSPLQATSSRRQQRHRGTKYSFAISFLRYSNRCGHLLQAHETEQKRIDKQEEKQPGSSVNVNKDDFGYKYELTPILKAAAVKSWSMLLFWSILVVSFCVFAGNLLFEQKKRNGFSILML